MFAFFGIGVQEIVLLAALGGLLAVIALVVSRLSARGPAGRVAELEDENRRLRDELDRARDRPA